MTVVDFLKKRTLLNVIYGVLAGAYFLCMVALPFVHGGFEWHYLHGVWQDWQTINASMIALTSTVIALNIAKVKENNERERRFAAARASLPHTLSELSGYCKQSGAILLSAWEDPDQILRWQSVPAYQMPKLSESYKDVFGRCIEHAAPDVGQFLAKLLGNIQVHNARLAELVGPVPLERHFVLDRQNLMSYIFSLGVIQAMINRLFEYSRDSIEFDEKLELGDCLNAYSNIGVHVADITDLRSFTERAVKRGL